MFDRLSSIEIMSLEVGETVRVLMFRTLTVSPTSNDIISIELNLSNIDIYKPSLRSSTKSLKGTIRIACCKWELESNYKKLL
jgi:hypothetical protein